MGAGIGGGSTLAAAGAASIATQSAVRTVQNAGSSTEAFADGSPVDVLLFGFKKNEGVFATSFNAS